MPQTPGYSTHTFFLSISHGHVFVVVGFYLLNYDLSLVFIFPEETLIRLGSDISQPEVEHGVLETGSEVTYTVLVGNREWMQRNFIQVGSTI